MLKKETIIHHSTAYDPIASKVAKGSFRVSERALSKGLEHKSGTLATHGVLDSPRVMPE